ncbi:MAG: hypothetical protein JWR77_741 [Rhizorhabdus sp.]|nr:hypothetical protein [Rhizorhabdus sp.]
MGKGGSATNIDAPISHLVRSPAMERLWFITNPRSGSASGAKCEAIEAVLADRGLSLLGRTAFPEEALPTATELDAAGVDTAILFAGDGTINAALCALADWEGAFLILPGGTMNMLAKQLHATAEPATIIAVAHGADERVALPFVEAGPYRAFVGVILGPAGNWFRAREAVRAGRVARLGQAVRLAWRRTFGETVRVAGLPGAGQGHQAIFVSPHPDGLDAAAIDAREWRSILSLGWGWMTGDWLAAQAVTHRVTAALSTLGPKPSLALFDGEPQILAPGTRITGGMTRRAFIMTREDPR